MHITRQLMNIDDIVG